MIRLSVILVAGPVLLLVAPLMLGANQDPQLQMLIDKAAERQALFDGVDAQYSLTATLGGGMGRFQQGDRGGGQGNRAAAQGDPAGAQRTRDGQRAERPSSQPQQRQQARQPDRQSDQQSARQSDRPRRVPDAMPSGGFTVETSARYAKSGDSVLLESQVSGATPFGDRNVNVRSASDGQISKTLFEMGDGYRGVVSAEGQGPGRLMSLTPEDFVTGLPSTNASQLDLLEARAYEVSRRRRGGGQTTTTVERQTRVVAEETIDGHKCIVVEVTESGGAGRRGRATVERLYFGEDVNYAIVRSEEGSLRDGAFVARNGWTMSDFREVKPGLFVPFSATAHRRARGGGIDETSKFAMNTLDFFGRFENGFFDVAFPNGAIVRDTIVGFSFTAGRFDLELDFLSPDVAFAEYDEDLEPEVTAQAGSGVAGSRTPLPQPAFPSRRSLVVALVVSAVFTTCAFFLLRGHRAP